MTLNTFSQFSETDRLKKVIIGRYEGYAEAEEYVEIVNEEQKKGLPSVEQLKAEFEVFKSTLEERGIEVLVPERVGKFVYDQLTPRDIGVTIGNRFLICNMVKRSRRYEVAGIFRYLEGMQGREPSVLIPPDRDILVEGGDIIVDKGNLFVGISQRTTERGFDYLDEVFGGDFKLIPVRCTSLEERQNVLHLDCTFNCIGEEHALIYPGGFKVIPEEMRSYRWIEVSAEEQGLLGTNVLSLDRKTIISRDHPRLKNLNERIRNEGFEVIEIPFNGAPSTGGSFRCCTLPLVREA